jgi:soluble lytic murein transglycosylase-like protein
MSGVSSARVAARRVVLSALAGGGLTAAGLGGPLSGGALAADSPTGLAPPSGTSTTPAPEETTQTTTTTTTATTPAETGTTTTPTPVGAPPTTPTQTTTTPQTATGPTSTTEAPKPHVRSPRVVVQHTQEPSEGEAANPAPTTATATPKPPTAALQGSGNIAAAPQLAAAQSSALAALMAGSAASTRALDFYRIPMFLLPIYQAAAVQYGVPWPILAAINEVETNFGTNLAVSTAGAVGWMQFMPETWLQYGVDALGAGYADPYNPVDAIFAAARYLHAAGASTNLRGAILAYNHSEIYAESVLLRARLFASYPQSAIATLTGLAEGSLPVAGAELSPLSIIPRGAVAPAPAVSPAPGASSTAGAGSPPQAPATQVSATMARGNAALVLPGSSAAPSPAASAARAERALNAPAPLSQLSELLARKKAPVVAVEDGRVVGIGVSRKLGRYLVLRDTYGDLFTYAGLGSIAPRYHLPKPAQVQVPKGALPSAEAGSDPVPKQAATAGRQLPLTLHVAKKEKATAKPKPTSPALPGSSSEGEAPVGVGKVRVFAHPDNNPDAIVARARAARLRADAAGWTKLARGSVVAKGTVLGHLGSHGEDPQASLRFAIRPAGAESAIDLRPILENWRQLDLALHPKGAKDGPVLAGATAGDALLLSRPELERAVLADPGIKLGRCDRAQVASGNVGRQVLALLVFLSRSGLKPTVGELRCGRAVYTAKGLITAYPAAGSVDIAAINGVPVAGHQGAGTIADVTIRTLLTLKHQFTPKRIVSLMKYPGAPSTLARADHSAYIQVELAKRPAVVSKTTGAKAARQAGTSQSSTAPLGTNPVLNSIEWQRLMTQIGSLQAPKILRKPSPSAIRDKAAPGNGGAATPTLP